MRGGRMMSGIQEIQVINEYKLAVEIGAKDRADRIYAANPDLHVQLDQAMREVNVNKR
jgi:hypothetical protein